MGGVNSPDLAAGLDRAIRSVDGWIAELDVEGSHGPTAEVLEALAVVLNAARWAEVDRETSKSLARRVVAAGADHENDTGEVGPRWGVFYGAFLDRDLIRRGSGLLNRWRTPDAPEAERMARVAAEVAADGQSDGLGHDGAVLTPTGRGCAACGMGGLVCSAHPEVPPAATTSRPDACRCGAEIIRCPRGCNVIVGTPELELINRGLAATLTVPAAPQAEDAGDHVTVDDVVLRDQTAGELGLTEGTRSDGDAARSKPGGED